MKKYLTIITLALLLSSCHGDPPMVVPNGTNKNLKEHMINANRTITQAEETAIEEYISRRQWKMEKLADGVRMLEYERGTGSIVNPDDSVTIVYTIDAINGKRFYDNVDETYVAGRRRDMAGLDEAVQRLRHGSKAKVILPSNLGYGIGGDGDRIPQSAILIIDLEVK